MSVSPVMRTSVGVQTPSDLFFEQLCRAASRVLLLDYDGTIAPFTAYRNRAFPYPTVPEYLDCIMSTCRTRVVLISGRAAREIPPLLGLHPHPEIWGVHGMEQLHPDGSYVVAQVSLDIQDALAKANASLAQAGLGHIAEAKPGAVAVHWRGLNRSEAEDMRAIAYRVLLPVVQRPNLVLAEFDGGVELRTRMHSKGDVVRTVLSQHGRDASVAYLGDDITDEDAFRALNGSGLTVLVRPTYRFTAAQTWIRPPEELVQFLSNWVQACGGDM